MALIPDFFPELFDCPDGCDEYEGRPTVFLRALVPQKRTTAATHNNCAVEIVVVVVVVVVVVAAACLLV